nr:MAG TPA: hypothetical protein [Caudoviricetes sp.]
MRKNLVFEFSKDKTELLIQYGNETIPFAMHLYKKHRNKIAVQNANSAFAEFNVWLTEQPQKWQEHIFNVYRDIRKTIDEENNVQRLLNKLNDLVVELYRDIDLQAMEEWIRRPDTPAYIPNKPAPLATYNEETTYGYSDYLKLMAFSLALRLVAPIWGDIAPQMKTEFNQDKEAHSMEILYGTCMMSKPDGSYVCEAEQRLKKFIRNTKIQLDSKAILVFGISEEDFYENMYSFIVLKQVAQGDLTSQDNKYQIIAQTYYTLSSKISAASKNYGPDKMQIQIKKTSAKDRIRGEGPDSRSVLDIGYVRSKLLMDVKMFLIHSVRDHQRIIDIICPDLPPELYRESMDTIMQMDTNYTTLHDERQFMKPIQDVQLTLTKWIVDEAIDTVIFDHLPLKDLIELIGLVRAILWHWGFRDIAALISAIAIVPTDDNAPIMPNHRRNIEVTLADRLAAAYPLAGTTKAVGRNMTYLGCIEMIDREISAFNWITTLPERWLSESTIVERNKVLVVSSSLRNILGDLMLFLERRQQMPNDPF